MKPLPHDGLAIRLAFLALAVAGFAAPPASAAPVLLKEQQAEKERVLSLNGEEVLIEKRYEIPAGTVLRITGVGDLKSLKSRKQAELAVLGRLYLGGEVPKGQAPPPTELHLHRNLSLALEAASSGVLAACANIEGLSLRAEGGLFMARGCRMARPDIDLRGGKVIFENCLIENFHHRSDEPPAELAAKLRFTRCVFAGAKNRLDTNLLWTLDRCDIHGRPFALKAPAWRKAPTALVSTLYLAEPGYREFVNGALRGVRGFFIPAVEKPFVAELYFVPAP